MSFRELAAMEGPFVLLTEEEYEALEAREQVPAEVIAEARRWAQNLRLWPRTATPTEDGFRLIPEDCLRVCSAAFDALLAAVEAAPAQTQVSAVIEWLREQGEKWGTVEIMKVLERLEAAVEDAPDARTPVPPEKWKALEEAGRDFAGYSDGKLAWEYIAGKRCRAIRDILPHLRPAPDEERLTEEECWAKLRGAIAQAAEAHGDSPGNLIVEWSGRDWVATFEAGSSSRGIGRHPTDPIAACCELASQAIPPPAPDFAAMSPDELRAWLDERGRRDLCEIYNDTWTAILWDRGNMYDIANVYGHPSEPAALLALCQRVAAKEAS